MYKIKILILAICLFFLSPIFAVQAQTENDYVQPQIATPLQTTYQGTIKSAIPNNEGGQDLVIKITNGSKNGQTVQVNTGITQQEHSNLYKTGDNIFLLEVTDPSASTSIYYITDFNRTNKLVWLFILFVFIVVSVSRMWGIKSIIGMIYSFIVIFEFLLPQLLKGYNPLGIAIFGAILIAPVTFYISHGVNSKTTVALVSTLLTLFITGLISIIFIELAKITGFGSDEAFFLQIAKNNVVNIKGLFLSGIIIGTLGILDDITISQSAVVSQLKNSVKGISNIELYKKSMEVGHDHIASAVNTLVLVYTGAALPLLLLFVNSSKTLTEAINSEIIADEIVRTLVSSIGLVLAVPISTLMAVYFIQKERV